MSKHKMKRLGSKGLNAIVNSEDITYDCWNKAYSGTTKSGAKFEVSPNIIEVVTKNGTHFNYTNNINSEEYRRIELAYRDNLKNDKEGQKSLLKEFIKQRFFEDLQEIEDIIGIDTDSGIEKIVDLFMKDD